MSRKDRLASSDPFSGDDSETGTFSFEEVDESLFGKIAQVDAGRQVIKPIPIEDIYPDLMQPRRAIPSAVRKYWSGNADSLVDVFSHWLRLVEEESDRPFDVGAYLQEGDDTERQERRGPIESALLPIVELAASIRRDGLTNPVTVARARRHYRLETGERRWMAYHLLYSYFDGEGGRPDERERWARIPARQVDQVSVWRQASENNARENLNAIGKARQFAVLLMDLLEPENFQPFEAFDHEQDFYAQIADAKLYRVPTGKNEQVMNAMGVASRAALSRYRSFLLLPREVWIVGDDYNLPDEVLYNLSRMDPAQAIAETHKIVSGQNNLADKTSASAALDIQYAPGTKRHFSQTIGAIQKTGHGKNNANTRALMHIRELRSWLNDQEQRIVNYEE